MVFYCPQWHSFFFSGGAGNKYTYIIQKRKSNNTHSFYTLIPFVKISAKSGLCIVVGLNGKLVEAKIRTWDT